MNEREWADNFADDVDQLLQTGLLPEPIEDIPETYAGARSVARTLSSIDFSSESKSRTIIRYQLLTGIDSRGGRSQNQKESLSMNTLFQKGGMKPILSVVILVGFLGLLFANLVWPGSVAEAAQNAVSIVQRLWVGENTFIQPIDPDQITIREDGSLVMQGKFVGEERSETSAIPNDGQFAVTFENRRFGVLKEAQAVLPFYLAQPGYLPEAYAFSHVNVFGEGSSVSAHTHFVGPDSTLMLSQRPIGDQPVSIGLPEDYMIETLYVNGKSATWAEHVLMWEADGVSFLLSSPDLDPDVAIRVAESLK